LQLIFKLILLCLSVSISQTILAKTIEVTDLAGRTISVPLDAHKIILGESRFIPAIAIVEPDITSRITAMLGDFRKYDHDGYQKYLKIYPELADIPEVGGNEASSFSIEKVIALQPELAIFGLGGHGPGSKSARVIKQLEAAGIAVVFIDFRQKPMKNTLPSIKLLGELFDNAAKAQSFIDVYQTEMNKVTSKLANINKPAPSVFLHSRVGLAEGCCESMSYGMIGKMVSAAGGHNIAQDILPGAFGTVNYEYLLTHQPDIYIATAIASSRHFKQGSNRVYLGATATKAEARSSLKQAATSYNLQYLDAIKQGRSYAVWHHFYSSPFNVAVIQKMAKWFYPQTFADLDPEDTLRRLYQQFQPVAYSGNYWVDLVPNSVEK